MILRSWVKIFLITLPLSFILSACQFAPINRLPELVNVPSQGKVAPSALIDGQEATPAKTVVRPGPRPPAAPTGQEGGGGSLLDLPQNQLSIGFEQMPLPSFIDAVFTKALGLNVQMDPIIAGRTDLVTMRTGGERPAKELFTLAKAVLASYGVAVVQEDKLVRIVPKEVAGAIQLPNILRGKVAPDAPESVRPIFQLVDLTKTSATSVMNVLQLTFRDSLITIPLLQNNALLLAGEPAALRAGLEAIKLFDQPRLAGKQALRLEPVYWTAEAFAEALTQTLRAEGYDVAGAGAQAGAANAIIFLPLAQNNSVLVFAGDNDVLSHVQQWALDLDQPARVSPEQGVFIYQVKNTAVANLSSTLGQLVGSQSAREQSSAPASDAGNASPLAAAGTAEAPPVARTADNVSSSSSTLKGPEGSTFILDAARNSIIFVGSASQYARIKPILETLDYAPREALIEVTVAEVTLDNLSQLGLEYSLNFDIGTFGGRLNTVNGLGGTGGSGSGGGNSAGSGSGLNIAILNADNIVRARLNALATDSRVSILSTPRLLAQSGKTARIQVGSEVPIITSQRAANSQNNGNSDVLQQVEYRNTGVILSITPTVHSDERIDLQLSQEVSDVQGASSGIASPSFFNRSIETQLSLRNGTTALIGGLIRENRSDTGSGVPGLKDIPLLGNLFRTQSGRQMKTELLLFITPYIISNAQDSQAITQEFRRRLEDWPQATGKLRY
jgi:general secretion pathway protein D